ncbi:MAG: ABC-type transport auxiliary lipoprotein family protein [Kiloniellales bacterium]|nr:ABC-type transport auxiliary lipoprotein family protein [Kiloniellales bacterium]
MKKRFVPGRHGVSVSAARRRQLLRFALMAPLGGLAAACGGLVPGQTPPPTLYRLTPKSTFRDDLPNVDWQLVLQTPQADASLNSTRIALQRSPMQVEYYARSSWTDRAPTMVQTLMIESFENSERIVSIGRESVGLRADFVLQSELREFQAEYFDGAVPNAHVNITVKLVRMPTRDIVGSQSFEATMPAAADRLDSVIEAFDEALGSVLRDLVEWTISAGTLSHRRA